MHSSRKRDQTGAAPVAGSTSSPVAQPAERPTLNREVDGANPSGAATFPSFRPSSPPRHLSLQLCRPSSGTFRLCWLCRASVVRHFDDGHRAIFYDRLVFIRREHTKSKDASQLLGGQF